MGFMTIISKIDLFPVCLRGKGVGGDWSIPVLGADASGMENESLKSAFEIC